MLFSVAIVTALKEMNGVRLRDLNESQVKTCWIVARVAHVEAEEECGETAQLPEVIGKRESQEKRTLASCTLKIKAS